MWKIGNNYSNNRQIDRQAIIHYTKKIQKYDPKYNSPEQPMPLRPPDPPRTPSTCYIATSIYGSYDCPPVWVLRRFRDETLAATGFGKAFIKTYYFLSPSLVRHFGQTNWFKTLFQKILDKLVIKLQARGVQNTPYADWEWYFPVNFQPFRPFRISDALPVRVKIDILRNYIWHSVIILLLLLLKSRCSSKALIADGCQIGASYRFHNLGICLLLEVCCSLSANALSR